LVNDISEGELHEWISFWKLDLEKGFRMLRNGLHSHIITSRYAVPLMLESPGGLIVEIGDGDTLDYRATLFYDLVKVTVSRFALAMAEDLYRHGVAAVAVTPGFMRTEAILEHFGVTESNWREAAKKDATVLESETPFFVGRAVAALAADPRVLDKSGGLYSSWELAREYGYADIDGSQPDIRRAIDFEEQFKAASKTGFRWSMSRQLAAPKGAPR
jgi:NAD(P)-dependent dehydrogenase (short-subunit alcohol dehydrogenase family)